MNDSQRFGINENEVVAQNFGDEVVVINLARGKYYSLAGTGVAVWEATIAGHNAPAIVEAVSAAYGIDQLRVGTDVAALIGQCSEHALLVPRGDGEPVPEGALEVEGSGDYATPELQVHDDVGHLLALDPPLPGLQHKPPSEGGDPQ